MKRFPVIAAVLVSTCIQVLSASDVLTTSWSGTTPYTSSTAASTPVSVSMSFVTPGDTDVQTIQNETMTTSAFFSNASVQGHSGLGATIYWDTTPTSGENSAEDDAGTVTVTVTFDSAVADPILHIDKIGGSGGAQANSTEWTVTTPGATLTKLAGVGHLEVETNKFYRTPWVSTSGAEASSTSANGTAAGSIQVNGTFTSLTFTVTGVGVEGTGGDRVEMVWEIDAGPANAAPVNTVPSGQTTTQNAALVFSSGNSNAISVDDSDAGSNPVEVTVAVTNGTFTLSGTSGLIFSVGDGTADAAMTFRGTVANVNSALEGLAYSPVTDYTGGDSLTLLTVDSGVVDLNQEANLIARYTFDDTGDLGNDSSPGGTHDGSVIGVAAAVDGTHGNVGEFDGSGDYVQITGKLGNPSSATLAAWVNVDAGETQGHIITLGDDLGLGLEHPGGGNYAHGFFWDGSTWRQTDYPIASLAGTGWHHLAYTRDNSSHVQVLYLDGQAVSTTYFSQSVSWTLGSNSYLGRHGNGQTTWDFDGLMEDARVYNRVLTADDVGNLAEVLTLRDTDNVAITIEAEAGSGPSIAYESFNDSVGSLDGKNGGTGWGGSWASASTPSPMASTVSGTLQDPTTYLDSTNNSATTDSGAAVAEYRNLSTTLGSAGTTKWVSFLLRPNGSVTAGAYAGLGLGGNVSWGDGGLFVGAFDSGQYGLEVVGGGARAAAADTTVAPGTTVFLVAKLEFISGNDTITLYVNPTPGLSSPDSVAGMTAVSSGAINLGSFTQVVMMSGDTLTGTFDEIRFGESYAEVAPGTIPPGGESSTEFTQSPSMSTAFTMPAGGLVTVTNAIEATNAPPASPDVEAVLEYGSGSTVITLDSPTWTARGGDQYFLVWSGVLPGDVTVPAGQAITLRIVNNEPAWSFQIAYDSEDYPSRIDLPTTTVIDMNAVEVYDAPYPGGNLIGQAVNGQTVYIRPSAMDPFGPYDVTSMDLVIDDPCGGQLSDTLTEAQVVATNGAVKIYEFEWQTGDCQGTYDLTVTAHEGSEGISDTMAAPFDVTYNDLGTPASGEFRDVEDNVTSTYPAYATIYVRVTDFDENEDENAVDTLQATLTSGSGDSETVTLTETGLNTGLFTGSIVSGVGVASQENGSLEAPQGDTITLTYTDADDSGDTFQVLATIDAAVPGIALSKTVYRGQDDGAGAPGSDEINIIAGDGVTFCFEVANTGDTYLNNVTVTDTDITPNVSTNIGLIGPGETVMVIAERAINASLTNTASVVGTPSTEIGVVSGLADETDADSAQVNVFAPVLDITKTSDPAGAWFPGDTVTYGIMVSNITGVAQTDLAVSDLLPDGLTYVSGSTFVTGSGAGGGGTLTTNTVRDEFNSVSYANHNGSESWSGNWTEINDGGSTTNGRVTVSGSRVRFLQASDTDGIQRSANLGGALSATLNFDWEVSGLEETMSVYISTNASGPWTLLETFSGQSGSASSSHDISSYISSQTTVKFQNNGGNWSASDDIFYMDNVEIEWTADESNVKDAFSNVSYGNNDGSVDWSAAWTEINDGGSPAGGRVTVSGDRIQFVQASNTDGLQRSADLTDALSAALNFDWEVSGLEESVSVYVSESASGPWTFLEAFTGQSGSGSRSFDISSYISSETTVKFQNNYGTWNHYLDIFYMDNVEIVWTAPGGGIGTTTGDPPPLLTSGLELGAGESVLVTFTATVDSTISSTQLVNVGSATSSVATVPHRAYVTNAVDLTAVSGQVRHDTDGNGNLADPDVGIEGVTVELFTDPNGDGDPADGASVRTNITDASGDYALYVWPTGTYVVVETDLAGYTSISDFDGGNANQIGLSIGAGEDLTGRHFLDARPLAISGTVEEDLDGDGNFADGDSGIANVTVVLFTDPNGDGNVADGEAVATNVTSGTGAYTFTNAAPGSYVIVETDPAGFASTADTDGGNYNEIAAVFSSGTDSAGHNFLDTGYAAIFGQVRVDADADGNLADPDSPLNGVTVQLWSDPNGDGDPGDGTLITSEVSDGSGHYSFSALLPGRYVVLEIDPPGYFSTGDSGGGDPNRIGMTLYSRTQSTGNDFLDTEQGSISGQIRNDVDGDGDVSDPDPGLTGVTVQLLTDPNADGNPADGTVVASVTTDPSGYYAFSGQVPGPYVVVEVDLPDFGSTGDADGGDPNRISLALLSGGNPSDLHFLDTAVGFDLSAGIQQSGSTVDLGEDVTYAITVVNTGQLPQTGMKISDALPSNVQFIPGSAAAYSANEQYTAGTPSLFLSDLNLPVGGQVTITFTARVMSAESIVNEACVSSDQIPGGRCADVLNDVFHISMTQGLASVSGDPDAACLGWTVNYDSDGHIKPYELMYVDRITPGFHPSVTNEWGLAATVTNTFYVDAGGAGRAKPGELGKAMRFYRAARKDLWRMEHEPRRATLEVYVLKNIHLEEGENWVSLFMVPDTNSLAEVLGRNELPGGQSIFDSTRIEWYGATQDGRATNEVWLSDAGYWFFKEGGLADDAPLPLNEGFNIVLPPGSGPRKLKVVGRVPMSVSEDQGHVATIKGAGQYNVVSYNIPYRVRLKDCGLREAGFTGAPAGEAVNPNNSDELRILQRGGGSLASPRARILMNANGQFVFWSGGSGSAENFELDVDDALIIYTRQTDQDFSWTPSLPYPGTTTEISP